MCLSRARGGAGGVRVRHGEYRRRASGIRGGAQGEASGLKVMNTVKSRKPLDEARFAQVRAAFARALPQLAPAGAGATQSGRGPAVLRPGPDAERLGDSRSRRKVT